MVFFSFREGIKSLFKARMATLMSIISITFTIFLLGLYLFLNLNVQHVISSLRKRIEIEVFIKPAVSEENILKLRGKIERIEGVESVSYITKDGAARRFKSEFGQDIYEIFDYNPLPSSFIITLMEDYRRFNQVADISKRIEIYPEVDDVVYHKVFLATIDRYIHLVIIVALVIGIIITIIAITLIYNTIRLSIFARKEIIKIMRLVGATEGFIKRPFIIEGIIQGLLGSLFASLIIFYGIKCIKLLLYPFIYMDNRIYLVLFLFAIIMGMLSANLSVKKYLHKI
jgi:cell division transport system permease protein